MEAIESIDDLQDQTAALALLERKVLAGITTAEESGDYPILVVSTFEMHSIFIQQAVQSVNAMKQEHQDESKVLGKILDNLIDELDMEPRPAEDLDTVMGKLTCEEVENPLHSA